MSYCINPHCPKPIDLANANNPICRNCGSQLLLQNRYRVLKQLGQGGFGNTFEIDDGGETKVLKVLTENNPKAVELFQQEAKVLSQLNSAGIPKVEADGYFTVLPKNSSVPLHCLVMEKIEGVNLEQWMEVRNYQPIAETQAIHWLKQIVEILALVHTKKYFHRDIKPQNIMLRSSGQLVLIDFGAVRQITTTILAGNSHTRIISQGYSPPEQQNGYSLQQSDFFALGRTFIFLLTGKEPQDKAIYDPLTNELHWRKYVANISPVLADLIDNLIAPTANQRPENTRVILQRLKDIEQRLNQVHIFRNTTKIQSKNSVSPTVAVSPGKPVQTTAQQTKKSLILWPLMMSSFLAPAISSVLTQNNNQDILKNVDTTPIISPSISNSSPVIPISKATPKAKPQIEPSPVNVVSSEDVEAEKARRKEIEKQKRLAVLKAEQERQAAREKQRQLQAAAKAEQERKAAKEAEKKREAERQERELEAAILAQLKEQAALQDKQRRQAAIQAEKAKQALRKKSQTTIVTVPKKRQSSTKGKVTRRKPENTQRANNNVVNTAKPWEITYPIPKASDELEQVIREGNQ
ncbi:protein kinase [Dolichospermum circinale CS-534/05]|uniref:serine/threonine protein kinase n=1 Tax=Dolichospermum circinale TaxID=109265 RepID=UPI00232D1CE7|nr:serine/threonine protein kinase [Dolichospermum circinale]MDB9492375.1 protein kinase [Dolichospermum circinale CS-534/05]